MVDKFASDLGTTLASRFDPSATTAAPSLIAPRSDHAHGRKVGVIPGYAIGLAD